MKLRKKGIQNLFQYILDPLIYPELELIVKQWFILDIWFDFLDGGLVHSKA
jgi:hypothetical protein